jgi:LmbE family N-acetylglucosaminyl deacetylase
MPSLLFVAAHPDDDVFGAARPVALHADDPDLRFSLIHATDGEAGEIAPDSGVTREELGAVRRRETRDGWAAVGRLPDRHEWWGLPDGGLTDHPFDDLVDRISAVLAEERPDVVVTFGPDGITGHPDHVTVSAATTTAFERLAGRGEGLRRLLYCAIPQSWIERWNDQRVSQGLEPWDPAQPFHLRGVPDATIGVEVDTEAVVDRVIAGVRAHKTQWSYQTMDSDPALVDSLRRDHYVIAWPPGRAEGPPLGDVFEGL